MRATALVISLALSAGASFAAGCDGDGGDGPGGSADAGRTNPGEPDAAGESDPDAAVAVVDAGEPDAAGPDATPPEPMPPFTVSTAVTLALAIDDAGLRETFTFDGQDYYSYMSMFLLEEGSAEECELFLRPEFVQFDTGQTSTRFFRTVLLDPSQSIILDDGCGWDDEYILTELGSIGVIELGFAQARFEEDRPFLDVFFDGDDWLPDDTASIVSAGAGLGFAMDRDGVVDEDTLVEPTPGTLLPALYQL